MELLGQYLKKSKKKWISHCIFKIWFGRGGFFIFFKFLKKPNIPKCTQYLVATWAKPNSVTALLSPLLTLVGLWWGGNNALCEKTLKKWHLKLASPSGDNWTFLCLPLSFFIINPLVLWNAFWSYKILFTFSTFFKTGIACQGGPLIKKCIF